MRSHSTVYDGSNAQPLPTSYEVVSIILTSNSGKDFDITNLVPFFEIKESLYKSSLEVTINVGDGLQILQKALISGNEKINLKVKQTTIGDETTDRKFDLDVYIAEVMNYAKQRPGFQTYQFLCFSRHMYMNNTKRLVRPFRGTAGSIIRNICTADLQIPNNRIKRISQSTKGIMKGIFPRMRPLQAINWLLRNSFDDKTPFYFYETAFDGIHLESYKDLLEKGLYETYDQLPYIQSELGTEDHYNEVKRKIRSMSTELNYSKLAASSEGAYAATIHSLDIAQKKYEKLAYKYSESTKLNEYIPFSRNSTFANLPFDEMKESVHYFISTNSYAYGDSQDNYHTPSYPTIGDQQGVLENLELLTHTLELSGDFKLSVGHIVDLDIPSPFETDDEKDKFFSGKHMITGVTHVFGEDEYTCTVTAQKDSLILDLDGETS